MAPGNTLRALFFSAQRPFEEDVHLNGVVDCSSGCIRAEQPRDRVAKAFNPMDVLRAFDAAGAVELGNDADTDAVLAALRKVGGMMLDPSMQRTLSDAALSGSSSPDPASSRIMFSPAAMRAVASGSFNGSGGGGSGFFGDKGGPPKPDPSFTVVYNTLTKYVLHGSDRVANGAVQALTDAVGNLNWGTAVSSPGGMSAVTEASSVAAALDAVTLCLDREALRRGCRMLYGAVLAKMGPRFAIDCLIASSKAVNSVRAEQLLCCCCCFLC